LPSKIVESRQRSAGRDLEDRAARKTAVADAGASPACGPVEIAVRSQNEGSRELAVGTRSLGAEVIQSGKIPGQGSTTKGKPRKPAHERTARDQSQKAKKGTLLTR
jgi:hypothetical protein